MPSLTLVSTASSFLHIHFHRDRFIGPDEAGPRVGGLALAGRLRLARAGTSVKPLREFFVAGG